MDMDFRLHTLADNQASEDILLPLRREGFVLLNVPENIVDLNRAVFSCFLEFQRRSKEERVPFLLSPNSVGDINGWHDPGGLSKYNQCREGYIFQASSPVWPMFSESKECAGDAFSALHNRWREEIHTFVQGIAVQIARELDILEADTFFSANGPFDIISGSQFHVKNTPVPCANDFGGELPLTAAGKIITLQAHRDPSVLSLIIHDREAYGLEMRSVSNAKDAAFREVYGSDCRPGPDKCVLVVGTLMERLSGGYLRAPYHRVVYDPTHEVKPATRLAITCFFQPVLDAVLTPFPSQSIITETPNNTQVISYRDWKTRAYGKYYKSSANKVKYKEDHK